MGNMRVDPEIVKAGQDKVEMKRKQTKVKKGHHFFDYLVVIDFEATCFGRDNTDFCQEIIQFPAVLVDGENLSIVDEFCNFVKPVINPELTEYCTNLTGITQDMVENACDFPTALQRFEEWLLSHELGTKYTFTIVTDGCYDMGRFLYKQCQLSGIKYPVYAYRWMNIRKAFCLFYHIRWYNLQLAVEMLGQKFQGRPHNGSDDALNIAQVVISLLKDGGEAIENERILLNQEDQRKNGIAIQNDRRIWFGLDTVQNISRKDFVQLYKQENSKSSHDYSEYIQNEYDEDSSGEDSSSPNSSLGKENINDDDEDTGSPLRKSPKDYGSQEHSYITYSPPQNICPGCYISMSVSPSAPRRCSYHCRVSSLSPIPGPYQFLPADQIFHPKYPVVHPAMTRRSNYIARSDNHTPLSRAQRPPGMLRRAVEAAVAASEKVS